MVQAGSEGAAGPTTFVAVRESGSAELVVQGSRFLALALPVLGEQAVEAALVQRRERHPAASHHVYAYRLAAGRGEGFSDDGEPSGTAGRPVLGAIEQRQLVNTAVIVTRYFGGTKLGAAGLVRAYRQAAGHAVDKAGTACWVRVARLAVKLTYAEDGTLMNHWGAWDVEVVDRDFANQVTVILAVPYTEQKALEERLAGALGRRPQLERIGAGYRPTAQEKG